jgi:hypothetical protein
MSEYRKEAWTDGEQIIFAALCEASGAVAERTAFKGVLPPQLDTWALNVSGGTESSTFKDVAPTEIKLDGIIQGQYSPDKRDLAQRTALAWLQALPIRQAAGAGPVYVARATRPPKIDWGYFPVFKNGEEVSKVGCWQVTLEIECVFRTSYGNAMTAEPTGGGPGGA